MKIPRKPFLSFLIYIFTASIMISNSFGYSLLSGITVLEDRNGVTIYEVKPNTFIYKAGIKKGDIIIQIDEKKIKRITDYVNYSKSLANKKHELKITIKRNDSILDFIIDEYSIPIKQFWGEKVVYSKENLPRNKEPYSYWMGEGERNLKSINDNTPYQQKIIIYKKAISCIYNAIHHKPEMITAMVLVANTYKNIGETLIANGKKEEAIENFKTSINLYKKAMAKSQMPKESLIEIRDNLKIIEELLNKQFG